MANDVKLQEGHPVDENLRPIKVGGKSTALEVSEKDVRVNNLYVNGTTTGVSASDDTKLPLTGGAMTGDITTDSDIISTHLTIDDSGDITLDAAGGDVNILQADLNIPIDRKVVFGNVGEYIVGDNTDLDIVSSNDATITAGNNIILKPHSSTGVININTTTTSAIELFNGGDGVPHIKLMSTIDTGDYCKISTTANGVTTIATVDDDGNDDADLTLDIDGKITLDSATGNFIAKKAGTEFSVANSAYAGMILGYTTVGIDATADSYSLTATMTVPDDAMKVKFVAPPSGVVEIFASLFWDTSRRLPVLGLSDANATTGYSPIDFPNANDVTNEHVVAQPPNSLADQMLNKYWVVTGLTAGTAYEWWFGAGTTAATGGVLRWGGTATGEYPPFIMKATALPTAVPDFAVYG